MSLFTKSDEQKAAKKKADEEKAAKKKIADKEIADQKIADDKKAVDDKAAKDASDREATDTKAAADKVADDKAAALKNKGQYVGKELTIEQGGAKFKGLCIGEREISSGLQVFVRLGGMVSRYFNAEDIVKDTSK